MNPLSTTLPSPGVLFLQYGDETRRVHITHELSSLDTLHALIVHMFPQKLTAGMLKSPNTAILIKDEARNVFYELEDVRDIQDRSIIKIYRKEPIYASFPAAAHLANGDLRVSWRLTAVGAGGLGALKGHFAQFDVALVCYLRASPLQVLVEFLSIMEFLHIEAPPPKRHRTKHIYNVPLCVLFVHKILGLLWGFEDEDHTQTNEMMSWKRGELVIFSKPALHKENGQFLG